MDQPTATEIRSFAPPAYDWSSYGFPEPAGGAADPLDVRIGWAAGTLYAITGRTLASITLQEETQIAEKVLVALVMLETSGGSASAISVMEQPWLKSFTAGSYSETRFSAAELAGSSGKGQAPPYPAALWALLWALMTEDKRDEWRQTLSGRVRPAAGFTPVDWNVPAFAQDYDPYDGGF